MSPRRICWWLEKHFFNKTEKDMLYLKPSRLTFSCGPATLKIYFHYYGVFASEKEIAKIAGTTNEKGTSLDGMLKAAEHFGFNAFTKKNSTLDDLRYYINKKIPVIVDWFCEDDGHYSIVVGINKKDVILRDPSSWRIKKMPIDKFLRVWFDFPGNYIEKSDDIIIRLMIVLTPKK